MKGDTRSLGYDAYELQPKLLVSPSTTPIVVPYIIPYITPFIKEFRLWLICRYASVSRLSGGSKGGMDVGGLKDP